MATTDEISDRIADEISDRIFAYMDSPEGKLAMEREAARKVRWPALEVVVPEGIVGRFTEEYEALASRNDPWVGFGSDRCEWILVKALIKAREVALRLDPEAVHALYTESMRLSHRNPFTPEQADRMHEIRMISEGHPVASTLSILLLICDPRLDDCGYPVAAWLPEYIRGQLRKWKAEVPAPYGLAWVDAAINAVDTKELS